MSQIWKKYRNGDWRMDKWKPMETAPKDGSTLLLAWDHFGWEYSVAFYQEGVWTDDSSGQAIEAPEFWRVLTPPDIAA